MSTARKINPAQESLVAGGFSKVQAAEKIAQGTRHLFSIASEAGTNLLSLAQKGLYRSRVPRFPWELLFFRKSLHLHDSRSRSALIEKVTQDLKLESKREVRERVEAVLEELITNAIYHATKSPEGLEKYWRTDKVILDPKERITITYAQRPSGIFLCVADHGGKLTFDHIQQALARCYGKRDATQIETKESGAGLGLYLVFESTMHLKIRVRRNKETRISCWIPRKTESFKEEFSFNFYDEE